MRPANERRRYIVTSSLIGWSHSHDDPWLQSLFEADPKKDNMKGFLPDWPFGRRICYTLSVYTDALALRYMYLDIFATEITSVDFDIFRHQED